MADFDVFMSYAHADRERVLALRDALAAAGLKVWLDEQGIDTFESISLAIERGLAHSRALLAFYSGAYPTRRACQWELTAAFLAAQRAGGDPRRRVLVVQPEPSADHVVPVELRDALFAAAPPRDDLEGHSALARRVASHVTELDGVFGNLGVADRSSWSGRRPVGAARFVGRMTDMWAVHSALAAGDVGLITGARGDPAVKVAGMGGIGKSMLAQEYALRFAAAYPGGVFWLRAHGHDDTGENLGAQARDAERGLQLLAFARDIGIDTAGLAPQEVPGALARVLDTHGQPFLWVVDDLPGDLNAAGLDRWLAPGRCGRTLLTTRSHAYTGIGTQINLGVLSSQEGLDLLAKHRVPAGPHDEAAARGLVEDLGRHALALDVAGGALRAERGVRSYAEYRQAVGNPDEDELELAAELAGELPGGHEASITTTLARSIWGLDDPAVDFLRLASLLAVDSIAADLVIEVFAVTDGLEKSAARRRAVAGMQETHSASLATMSADGSRQVHALVSRTIERLDRTPARATAIAQAATRALTRRLQTSSASRVSADGATLAHARHLASPLLSRDQATLMHFVAEHHFFRADYRTAGRLQERVLDAFRRVLGDEHPDTLTSMNNLAGTLGEQGDLASARALLEQVLAALRRVLGDEDPDTLTSISNLAATVYLQGDLAGARTLQEQALAARRMVLGDDHPDTLMSMNNLAATLGAQGDRTGAHALQEKVLVARRLLFGDEHPSTLTAIINVAETLSAQGDLTGARALQEQALDTYRRVLGDEHPNTLTAMNNLAGTLSAQGNLPGARALQEQALATCQRVLGDEHHHTLGSMINLAETLRTQGNLAAARALQEQALEASRRLLGEVHPATLASMNNLAGTLWAVGDLAGARALQEQTLQVSRRLLGDEHPDTLTAMKNLAATLRTQNP